MLKAVGLDGVQRRIAELQSRLDALDPSGQSQFSGVLEQNMPGSMGGLVSGNIGGGGFTPYNPMGGGATVGPDENLKTLITKAANDNNLDPDLLDAVVQAESGYNPLARSHAGAMGLTQLMPNTAAGLGVGNPFNPQENLNGGAKYLAQLLDHFDGNIQDALAAYNAGPNRVKRGGVLPLETTRYIKKVMGLYEARKVG